MSYITTALLVYGHCLNNEDNEVLLEIANAPLSPSRFRRVMGPGISTDGLYGEANIAVGAFSPFPLARWLTEMKKVNFGKCKCEFVQLILQDDPDVGFGIINVYEGPLFDPFSEARAQERAAGI